MRLLYRTSKFAIYDDVLSPEEFTQLFSYVQDENYGKPIEGNNWIKVWRLGDCSPVAGPCRYASQGNTNTALDLVKVKMEEAAKAHPELVQPFKDLSIRPYLYPRGTKLSWHDDSTVYSGAATFYCHKKWGSTWGGELLVAETPALKDVFAGQNLPKPHMDHEWEDHFINIYGMGHFISPKPNRLVLMAPGVYHSINRVDPDAGDHLRASVVGFYLKETAKKSSATTT